LASWTDAEIEREIRRLMTPPLSFACEWDEGVWRARIFDAAAGLILHEDESVDRRLALYAVYGHLWLKDHRSQPGSQWDASAPRPSVASVTRYVHSTLADPADLDPAQVAAVYGLAPSHKR